jgi:hypothetical protein
MLFISYIRVLWEEKKQGTYRSLVATFSLGPLSPELVFRATTDTNRDPDTKPG